MMALTAEKEQLEKDLQAIEEKVKAAKTSSKDQVVEELLKGARSDKKPDSDRIKQLKSELKKGRGTVLKLRSAWQGTMVGATKRKVIGAVSPEEATNVVNRFRGVLEALRPKDTHQVVVNSASKFLSAIGRESTAPELPETVPEGPEEDELQPSEESKNKILDGLKRSQASPTTNHESGSRRRSTASDFSRLMADMHTGRRPSSLGVQTKRAGWEVGSPSSVGRRGSMLNLIAKAKGTEHGEDDDEDGPDKPGAKASSTVRFSLTEQDANKPENSSLSSDSNFKEVFDSARRPVRRTTPGSNILANAATAASAMSKLDEDEEQESGSEA